jgi:hypothetical protein
MVPLWAVNMKIPDEAPERLGADGMGALCRLCVGTVRNRGTQHKGTNHEL